MTPLCCDSVVLCCDTVVLWQCCVVTVSCCDTVVLWQCCVVTVLCCDTVVLWHCCVVTLLCCDTVMANERYHCTKINKIQFSVEYLNASTNPKQTFSTLSYQEFNFLYILEVVFEKRSSVSLCLPVFPHARNLFQTSVASFSWHIKGKGHPCKALRLCTGRTAHRGSRGIAIPLHDHGTRRGWGFSLTPRPLFTPGKTRYPLYTRLGGPQGRSGQVRKISPTPGFDPRTVQPVASRYTDWATQLTYNLSLNLVLSLLIFHLKDHLMLKAAVNFYLTVITWCNFDCSIRRKPQKIQRQASSEWDSRP